MSVRIDCGLLGHGTYNASGWGGYPIYFFEIVWHKKGHRHPKVVLVGGCVVVRRFRKLSEITRTPRVNLNNRPLLMRRNPLALLLGAFSLVTITIRGNDIEPGKEFYTVIRTPNPIVLDGDLSEWTGVPVLADPKFYVRIGCEGVPACRKGS